MFRLFSRLWVRQKSTDNFLHCYEAQRNFAPRASPIPCILTEIKDYLKRHRLSPESCSKDCFCIGNLSDPWGFHENMQSLAGDGPNDDVVKVFHSEEEKIVEIVMRLYGTNRTIQRSKSETLQRSLERIEINVKNANAKLMSKAKRKQKKREMKDSSASFLQTDEASPAVTLHDLMGNKIDGELDIISGWERGRALKMCDFSFRVVCNPPKVVSIKLVRMPIVGIPIYPQLQLKMATIKNSRFEWYRRLCPNDDDIEMDVDKKSDIQTGKHKMDSSDCESDVINANATEGWELVGEDRTYTARVEDVGYAIRLKVHPGNEKYPHDSKGDFHEEAAFATTESTVIEGPEKLLFTERIKHTTTKCGEGSFRFVCYNILADVYASTEYAHDFLFPYCPTEAMDIDYRQQLILKELIGYNADIMCLQEVDRSVFESYYMPAMSLQGYAGAFAAKDGIKEGVALFYRREKFRLLLVENIVLRKAFKEERNRDLYKKLAESDDFLRNFLSKPTCLLVGMLQSVEDPTKNILIGNTHLYWHPNGCHIRLIQVELILREMRHFYAEQSAKDLSNLSCIVAGDFNSKPSSGVVKLFTDGEVPANHADWFSMGKAEYLPDLVLKNPTKFKSACGFPPYTNIVTRFQDSLDYIFVDDLLEVEKVIPHPSHEDIVSHTALPNATAPSDHIAQVVDLAWKT